MLRRIAGKVRVWQRDSLIKRLGIRQVKPNYAFLDKFKPGDVAIDIGVGNDPDFSRLLIDAYKMDCFAVDPTRKHAAALKKIEDELPTFHYRPFALGPENGETRFFESRDNVSGSLLNTHRNIVNDQVIGYDVEMITMDNLFDAIGVDKAAIVKIDVEGVEYQVIKTLSRSTLNRMEQLIIEFHHETVPEYTAADTKAAIKHINGFGMKSLVYNGRDCLFYWPDRR